MHMDILTNMHAHLPAHTHTYKHIHAPMDYRITHPISTKCQSPDLKQRYKVYRMAF